MRHQFKALVVAAAAVAALSLLAVPAMAGSPAHQHALSNGSAPLTPTSGLVGLKDPVYTVTNAAGGGDALTVAGARSLFVNSGANVISYGAPDCFTGNTCGDPQTSSCATNAATGCHNGTVSQANFETQLGTILKSSANSGLGDPSIVLQLFPVNFSNGTCPPGTATICGSSFCPTLTTQGAASPSSTEWGLDLAADKTIVDSLAAAVSTTGVSPAYVFLESSNEGENQCWSKWGYTSTVQTGVSKALGHMYAAVMTGTGGLLTYAANALPGSGVAADGYIGTAGGILRGDSCVTNVNFSYGYKCTFTKASAQVADFNNAIKTDAGSSAYPGLESIHSYCHSPDFTTTSGYTLDNNECYAYYNQWRTMAAGQINTIWGSTAVSLMGFGVTEWQAGVCGSTNATCWSGFQNGASNGTATYDSGFWTMLTGNSTFFGTTGTAYFLQVQFDDAGNADGQGLPGAPDNNAHPSGNYNVIQEAGTKGEGYTAFCNAGAGTGC
jgi:hypothetical protein